MGAILTSFPGLFGRSKLKGSATNLQGKSRLGVEDGAIYGRHFMTGLSLVPFPTEPAFTFAQTKV